MMPGSLILSLIQNTAILLSFSMLYDHIWAKDEIKRGYEKILAGFVVGGIGLILMFTPWTFVQGLVFDTRSILLCISGLFLGFIPTLLAVLITGIGRILMGGEGMWMGLSVIVSSGAIGYLWRVFRPSWQKGKPLLELLSMGILVHLTMLACTALLPGEHILRIFRVIFIPILCIYAPGTMLLGALMLKRAESWKNKKALRESQALYVSLVEHMPAGVYRKSSDGRYDYVNARYCALKGLTKEEILGKNPQELSLYEKTKELDQLFPRQKTLVREGLESHEWIMKHGARLESEESYDLEDGGKEYFQVVKIPVFSMDGKVVGSQGMLFDITFQKNLQTDLIAAKEKAEDSDRLKTSFLHNLSHEIRTPMNAIIGFSGFLKEADVDLDQRKYYIDVIIDSSKQLLSIIDDLVRISTIESGQEKLIMSDFLLNDLCRSVFDQFKEEAEAKELDFQVSLGLNTPADRIISDQNKLYEVLTNLLVNAFKFTRVGHIHWGYALKSNVLEFFVEDTGIGIELHLQEEIFKRFSQIDNTLTRQYGGSGLGLSICKAYIDLLGGQIEVKSKLGEGARFEFTIPYELIGGAETLSKITDSRVVEKVSKILVAEDEDLNFILLNEILAHLNVEVTRAKNGLEALELLNQNKTFDLVLMDLRMPVMDGYEATRKIKQNYPSLPVLALTAYTQDMDKKRALECGCSDFISKPYNKAELIQKIEAHLGLSFTAS